MFFLILIFTNCRTRSRFTGDLVEFGKYVTWLYCVRIIVVWKSVFSAAYVCKIDCHSLFSARYKLITFPKGQIFVIKMELRIFMMTPSNGNIFRVTDRSPVNSPHKGHPNEALIFSLICAWTNGLNHSGADDLIRHRSHYDGTIMSHINLPI